MPLRIDPRDRKLLLGAVVVFALLIGGTVFFGGDAGQRQEVPTSYSTASGGAKAAYLLLAHSGHNIQRWERRLTELPAKATVILADPTEAATREERDSVSRFLSEGGRIIATGIASGTYLPENNSVPDPVLGLESKTVSAVGPSAITRAAPQITIAPQARWQTYSPAYALYGDRDKDEIVVVKYPYGPGEVIWWGSSTPLTNFGLQEPGNLEFLLACVGDRDTPILWDEYIHGYRETLGASVIHSPVKWLVLQLALLGLAVIATFSRRNGPIFTPVVDVRLSPLEFVHTLGGLYENAGSASVAVDICYQRFRYWLNRRLGVSNNISVADLETAARERFGPKEDQFGAILRRCESAKADPHLTESEALHLVQELDQYATRWKLFQGGRKEKSE